MICVKRSWTGLAEEVCRSCGGECCRDAHPPISPQRRSILLSIGCPDTVFEDAGYTRLKCRPGGMCVMCRDGRCAIHDHKPETCVSGPFTFDRKDGMIAIYVKKEEICPLVRYLKQDPGLYREQMRVAVDHIRRLFSDLPPGEMEIVLSIPEPATDLVTVLPLEGDAP